MSKLIIEQLNNKHIKDKFCCNVEELDHYITTQAKQDQKRHVAAIYVLTDDSNVVIGYYSLSSNIVLLDDIPEDYKKKYPRYPALPATLLGRLAVDQQYQGKKYGEILLLHALEISLYNSVKIGSVAVIVDTANKKAETFYQAYGFIKLDNSYNKQRLFLPIGTIEKLFNTQR